jgi:hypothetical protein
VPVGEFDDVTVAQHVQLADPVGDRRRVAGREVAALAARDDERRAVRAYDEPSG